MRIKATMEGVFARFWAQTQVAGPDECWIFTGNHDNYGYGLISFGHSRMLKAHRVSKEIELGRPVSPGAWVLHRCDNPPCVNPAHLYEGTPKENTRDMIARGRNSNGPRPFGTAHHAAKLTEADVRTIRAAVDAHPERGPLREALARQYGVTSTLIQKVAKRHIWRHVT